jgi:PAS domain S-box-containing protein
LHRWVAVLIAGREWLIDDSPAGLRRLVMLLYALVFPPFVGALTALAEGRARTHSILTVLVLCGAAMAQLALARRPRSRDLIVPVGIVPTACCAIAFAAAGADALGFVAVLAAPLAWAAVLCAAPVVVSAWATGVIGCFVVAYRAHGWVAAVSSAALFGLVQGLVAAVVHGRTSRFREARLRSLEKQLNDIELLVRADGVIVDANDRAAAAYGYPVGELVGTNVHAVRMPEDRGRTDLQLRAVEEQGGLVFETQHVRRDGTTFPVEVSSRAYRIGGETYLHSVVRDASARHAAESQRRFLEVLFRHMAEGVVVLDEQFRVKLWSPGAEELFGWKAEEVVGRSPFEFLIPPESEAETARAIAAAAAGDECTRLMRRCRKDGTEIITSVNIVAVQDASGAIAGVMSVARDVTAEQQAARALRESEARLLRANEAREKILHVVAHDLRNPLAAIAAAAGRLETALEEPDPRADLLERRELVESSVKRMGRLIADLLDEAAIRKGTLRLTLEEHEAAGIVQEAARTFRPLAEQAQVALELALPPTWPALRCDRGRMLQVLGNLLSNALQVTPAGGRVALRLAPAEGGLQLTVQDTGPGLPAGAVERLFEPYQRGGDASYSGVGLGLAIARGIVVAHAGRIWAERPAEGGAAFQVWLPANVGDAVASGGDGRAQARAPRVGAAVAESAHADPDRRG